METIGPSEPTSSIAPPAVDPATASSRAAALAAPDVPALRPFVFAGTGSGYFRIWIVNLLLTIITVGLYSPWAKVRRLRYFYGNTLFDGSAFEFHGRPFALFKGRVIGLALLIAYTQAGKVSLKVWLGTVVVLIFLLPWLLWSSLRFRFGNSSYRGIRFAFDGTIAQAYLTFVPLMLMFLAPTFITLLTEELLAASNPEALAQLGRYYLAFGVGLLFAPWFYFRLRAYQHRHARLGSTPFAFRAKVRSAYGLAFRLALLSIGFGIIAGVPAALVAIVNFNRIFDFGRVANFRLDFIVAAALGYLLLISGFSQPMAMIQNFVWKHSTLGGASFDSRVHRSRMWWILLCNLFMTFVTLGLFWPFAVVRSVRYRIGSLSWSGDSNGLLAASGAGKVGAAGEETADLFGLDIAL